MTKKNLILTIMHGYDYPFVEPFLKSLKETGYTGDLVVFVSDAVSKTTKRAIKNDGAVIINYNTQYPFIEKYSEGFKNIDPAISINNYRFILYLQFLLEHGDPYENVMLADFRDVIFQQEPFSRQPEGKICFFMEDAKQVFSHHENKNSQWLADATDTDTAQSLEHETICCAGITIGDTTLVIDYLNYMKAKLSFRTELKWGLDQGIHNAYVYLVKPGDMMLFNYQQPFVSNMGAYQPYKLNNSNEVVNNAGEPYAIVHQYDRFGELLRIVKRKYSGSRITQKLKRLYFLLMP